MATLDHDAAYQIAKQAGATDDEAQFLAAVAGPESGYRTDAHNPNASTGDNSYGLWQVNMLGQMGVNRAKQWGLKSYDQLFDPLTNARAALDILRSQGKKAWTTYTSGAYKPFLSAGTGAGLGAAAGSQDAAPVIKQASQEQGLLGALQSAGGQDYTKLTSAHGDTLGDRLNSIMDILHQNTSGTAGVNG
jgi:soluble lytic murein transglycosylase-like protein